MKLKLKEGKEIINVYGTPVTNVIMEAYDLHIDKYKTMTVKVGVFDNNTENVMQNFEPMKILTWEFSLHEELPTFDTNNNRLTTGHRGSSIISQSMGFLLPVGDNPSIIVPLIKGSQLWILAQPYDENNSVGDLFEFIDGLISEEQIKQDITEIENLEEENLTE